MKSLSQIKYARLIDKVRGTVLTACINLELIMDVYICEKFCSNKAQINEMASLIVTPRVQWNEKLQIFKVLISKHDNTLKVEYPSFVNDIKNIIEHRNVFAHLPADLSKTGIEEYNINGRFTFHKFKTFTDDKTKEIGNSRIPFYTPESIDDLIYSCNLYTLEIKKLIKIA